ncbi:hypothetical protein NDU88_009410 [Pleurodeles waltl]|uniref:Uncharacterized protein n=1 Tax=Pleurodeles waltl TaxID=8319 RepID=A0AAV7PS09_PLEWA|nr:hypothetical protein NDU88_009410 [Pleurodeles waltl]
MYKVVSEEETAVVTGGPPQLLSAAVPNASECCLVSAEMAQLDGAGAFLDILEFIVLFVYLLRVTGKAEGLGWIGGKVGPMVPEHN